MVPAEGFNDLVRQARAGQPQAQEELLRRLRPYLERLASGLADPPHARRSASDLVQEALLRVWQKLDQFDGTAEDEESWAMFRSWVGQILRRLDLNDRRDRNAQRRRPPQPIAALPAPGPGASGSYQVDPPANGPTVSATVRQAEQTQLIQAALERMDDEVSAAIIRLHFFEGLSLRQIAGRLSLSYDKVRDRYAAGMRHLERELGSLQ
jgi:RNA polymerase sigma factor (sigma-70 family)